MVAGFHRLGAVALGLLLAGLGLAAAPAPSPKPFRATGSGMTGQVAMQELKTYARDTCRQKLGPDRDAFALDEIVCDGNPAVRVTFTCRAKARCEGAAQDAPTTAPERPAS